METRKCTICGKITPLSEMSKSYPTRCKRCVAEHTRLVRQRAKIQQEQVAKESGYLTKNNLQESFYEVINQAEERGHINMDDVRKLANSGIPFLNFCTDRSVFFDAIRYRFEKWLNSL